MEDETGYFGLLGRNWRYRRRAAESVRVAGVQREALQTSAIFCIISHMALTTLNIGLI